MTDIEFINQLTEYLNKLDELLEMIDAKESENNG